MLPLQFRLKNPKRISKIFQDGNYIHGKYVFVKYLPGKYDYPRLAFSLNTKFISKAVNRNRVKRLLREVVRNFGINKLSPLDIVIISKKPLNENTSFQEIQKDMSDIFTRLR
jgi:ribonuclease P protein component